MATIELKRTLYGLGGRCFTINIDSYVEASSLLKGDEVFFIHMNNKPTSCDPEQEACDYSNYLISDSPYINLKLTTNIDKDKCLRISLKNSTEGEISGSVGLLSHNNNWWLSVGDYSLKSSCIMSNIFPERVTNSIGFGDYSPTPISGGLLIDSVGLLGFSIGYKNLYRPVDDFNTDGNTLIDNNPDYSKIKLLEGTLIWERDIFTKFKLRTGYTYNYFNDDSGQIGSIQKDILSTVSVSINYNPMDNLKLKLSYLNGQTPDVKLIKDEPDKMLADGQLYINGRSNINLLALSAKIDLSKSLLLNIGGGRNTDDDSKYYKLILSKLLFKNTILDVELGHINGDGLNKDMTTLKSKVYINY